MALSSIKNRIVCSVFIWIGLGCAVFPLSPAWSEEESEPGKIQFTFAPPKSTGIKAEEAIRWSQLETRHTQIQYANLDDLKKFDRKIDFSPEDFSIKTLFSSSKPDDMLNKIREKIDALHERVQEILDMRKRSEKKLKIQLYAGKQRLREAYRVLFGDELNVRAWYLFEMNTIFINVDDIHEGMLAHEMAHSVIDNFLTVRPPRASAEILAVYVDSHLFRKTKKYNRYE